MKNSLLFVFPLLFLGGFLPRGPGDACAADSMNVHFVGHSDLQGRAALQVVLKGNYA